MDISKLTSLYKVLLESVLQTFPSYRDRRPIQRQMTRTIVPDIIWLGYSLVNKSPAKDMDKFLIRPNSESIDNILPNDDTSRMTASLQDLLVVVADLKNKVIKHDSEIGGLQELNSTLQSQIYLANDKCNALSTELDQLRCCHKTLTRDPGNSVTVTQSSLPLHESAALHSEHQSGNESDFQITSRQQRRIKQKKSRSEDNATNTTQHVPEPARSTGIASLESSSETDTQRLIPARPLKGVNPPSKPLDAHTPGMSRIYIGGVDPHCSVCPFRKTLPMLR